MQITKPILLINLPFCDPITFPPTLVTSCILCLPLYSFVFLPLTHYSPIMPSLAVPPKKIRILNEEGLEVSGVIGPYPLGASLTLICQVDTGESDRERRK